MIPTVRLTGLTACPNEIVGRTVLGMRLSRFITMESSMSQSLTRIAPVALILAGSLTLGGCATKGYVNEQIATVNQRIDALDTRLQTTDGTAKAAQAEAQAASGQAQNNSQRIDQLNARVDGVEQQLQQKRRPRN